MEWTDEGIVLGVRRHGESSAIVELLTREHGRHLGLVRGGASSRMRPLLQPGNSVTAVWRARLDEHLGTYAIEGTRLRAATLLASSHAVYGVTHLASLARLLPERDPYRDRLLRLPAFLREGDGGANGWSDQDLQDGFRLTGLFLLRHVLEPRGQGHSDARDGFINAVTKRLVRLVQP